MLGTTFIHFRNDRSRSSVDWGHDIADDVQNSIAGLVINIAHFTPIGSDNFVWVDIDAYGSFAQERLERQLIGKLGTFHLAAANVQFDFVAQRVFAGVDFLVGKGLVGRCKYSKESFKKL